MRGQRPGGSTVSRASPSFCMASLLHLVGPTTMRRPRFRSLVEEDWLAATILQIAWKRRMVVKLLATRKAWAASQGETGGDASPAPEAAQGHGHPESGAGEPDVAQAPNPGTTEDEADSENPFEKRRDLIRRFFRSHVREKWRTLQACLSASNPSPLPSSS